MGQPQGHLGKSHETLTEYHSIALVWKAQDQVHLFDLLDVAHLCI